MSGCPILCVLYKGWYPEADRPDFSRFGLLSASPGRFSFPLGHVPYRLSTQHSVPSERFDIYTTSVYTSNKISDDSSDPNRTEKTLKPPERASSACWKPNARKKEMPSKRSAENEYRVTGSVLDELGLDRQAALELKLKAALHSATGKTPRVPSPRSGTNHENSTTTRERIDARQALNAQRSAATALCRFIGCKGRSEAKGASTRGRINARLTFSTGGSHSAAFVVWGRFRR
jgi:hypothetical protein